jgi:hypothetical protein
MPELQPRADQSRSDRDQAETCIRFAAELRELSNALKGEVNRLHTEPKAESNTGLLTRAADVILKASCEGALQHFLNLSEAARGSAPLIEGFADEHQSRKKVHSGAMATIGKTESASHAARHSQENTLPAVDEDASETAESTPPRASVAPTTATDMSETECRYQASRARLEELCTQLERDGDPVGDEFVRQRVRLLVDLFWYLSTKYPTCLSSEASRVKNEFSPPQVFLQGPRVLVEAAWVLEFLADRIEAFWDRITMKDAAKEHDIRYEVIYRAIQNKAGREPLIDIVGKSGREYLLTRRSVIAFAQQYHAKKEKKRQRAPKGLPAPCYYECRAPGCDWSSDCKLNRQPLECPKCDRKTVRPLIPSQRK